MAAAFRLQQAGFEVRIFEANDRVGGRTKTTRRGDFTFDSGAVNVLSSYSHTLGILAEAGLSDQVVPCGSMIGIPRDGDIHYIEADQRLRDIPALLGTGLLSTRSKIKLTKLAADVVRARSQLSYADLWKATDLDRESAGAYSQRVLNDEILDVIVDNVTRGSACVHADQLSKADFFFALAKWMGVQLLTFRDGMSTYAELMAQRFDVRLQTKVVQVEESGDEVSVTYTTADGDEQTDRMAGCVIAVPAAQSAALTPQLDDWRATYLQTLPYSTGVVLTVGQSKPASQPASLFLTPRSSQSDVSVVTVPSNMTPWRVPAGKGVVTMIAAAEMSARLIDADDDHIVKSMVIAMNEVSPGLAEDIEWAHIDRWDPLLPVHGPGYTRDLARFKHLSDAKDRRIHLAGDYWAIGCVETSTASGERAGRALVHYLRNTQPMPSV